MTAAHWPEPGDAGKPDPLGRVWPCGHPKTLANTQFIGKSGARCRICRRRITRESADRRKAGRNSQDE
jgi:hypothetical protein